MSNFYKRQIYCFQKQPLIPLITEKLSTLLLMFYIFSFLSHMINMDSEEEEKKISLIITLINCYKHSCETVKDIYSWCVTKQKTPYLLKDFRHINKSTLYFLKSWNWMNKKFKDWTTFPKVFILTWCRSNKFVRRFIMISRK